MNYKNILVIIAVILSILFLSRNYMNEQFGLDKLKKINNQISQLSWEIQTTKDKIADLDRQKLEQLTILSWQTQTMSWYVSKKKEIETAIFYLDKAVK